MSLKEQEKSMMNEIENEGLERYIRHLRFEKELGESLDVEINGKVYENTSDLTISILIDSGMEYEDKKKLVDSLNQDVKEGKNMTMFKSSDYDVESTGVAICDKRDTFNKRLGRVIATGRALKQYKGI